MCTRSVRRKQSVRLPSDENGDGSHSSLIRDWLNIFKWREMHICIAASGIIFYVGGWLIAVFLLQTYLPPSGAILFWTTFISLTAGAAAVDKVRKSNAGL